MNLFSKILSLLPILILAVEKIGADLAGHQKKQMVSDILQSVADGVSLQMPDQAKTAQAAASLAISTMDSVVAVVKAAKHPAVSTQEVAADIVAGR